MPLFRIYYGDGTTVEGDTQAQWNAAPERNVQVVVVADALPLSDPRSIGRAVYRGVPFYIWPSGGDRPVPADVIGLLDDLNLKGLVPDTATVAGQSLQKLKTWGVKTGRTITDVGYDALLLRATDDPGFPRKSATRAGSDFIESLPRV